MSYTIDLAYRQRNINWDLDRQLEVLISGEEFASDSAGYGFGLRDMQFIIPERPPYDLLQKIKDLIGPTIVYCSCVETPDYYEEGGELKEVDRHYDSVWAYHVG